MEGSNYYYSDEEGYYPHGTSGNYYPTTYNEVWSDPDSEIRGNIYSSPQQNVWNCCEQEPSPYSSEYEQSQPGCSYQDASSTGSEAASPQSESSPSEEEDVDSVADSEASETEGKSLTGSTEQTDSCRNSDASSSSWETASSEESDSSWETATTCSYEAAALSAVCQRRPAEKWMNHPFLEGGGGSGSLVPRPPSFSFRPRAPPQRRTRRERRKTNDSGEGRRQEQEQVSEQKQARRPRTVRHAISAPAESIPAQKANPTKKANTAKKEKPRRCRFRWNHLERKKRKSITVAVRIDGGVAGPSGKNQRRLRTASR